MNMKTKKGFMLRNVAGRDIVVPIGQASVDFNGVINLNESGAFLWKELAKGCTYDELLNALLREYDVSEDIASRDIDAFLDVARKANVLDED